VTFKLDQPPMMYKLAKELDRDQESCEDLRLLYVALTRAKSKLLISTHCKMNEKGEIKLDQWAKDLVKTSGVQSADLIDAKGIPFEFPMSKEHPLRVWCALPEISITMTDVPVASREQVMQSNLLPLYQAVDGFLVGTPEEVNDEVWQVTNQGDHVSGDVLGTLVHKAIQRWIFPGDPRLISLLETEMFNIGLIHNNLRRKTIDEVCDLLSRLHRHSIWCEFDGAMERYSELPYTYMAGSKMENRVIDLLYRDEKGWRIIDFKTDPIRNTTYKNDLLKKYIPQLRSYKVAVKTLIGVYPVAQICFLDDHGEIGLVEVN
jgi:ATP-dependent exoDNAse (exonuclease V) beta subunit